MAHLDLCCEALDVPSLARRTDVVFLALPHRVSFQIVPGLIDTGKKVIDLSADFRLANAAIYEKWYGEKHTAHDLLKEAVYGLPEIYRNKIASARLIANPGCYPTTVILGCAPLLKSDIIDLSTIIIDAKSGISGAGRKAVEEYYKKEHPNFRPYNIAGAHRHTPEIEQELSRIAGKEITVTFTTHIMPVERGMLSTIYINLKKKVTSAEITARYKEFYREEPFVRVLDEGKIPEIKNVANTNFCEIGCKVDERTNRLILVSAIDNLLKGASGQAVQNMNIMFGLKETDGLI
jgi:N-acetyl-gamma-glutamyl-phosphate reductase